MNLIQTVIAFLVVLGTLIAIHELGHYWVARWCGVKVLRFSLGMGKVVWSRKFGPDQTEWAVSVLPLGGYVKMLDAREQDLGTMSPEDRAREFTGQSVWRRIAIVAAGPIANFLLAIALFAGLFMYGIAEPSSKIGTVAAGTAGQLAGLHKDDKIVAINGQAVQGWSDLRWQIIQAAIDKNGARLDVERPNYGRASVQLQAADLARLDLEGDVLGKLGIVVARPPPVIEQVVEGGAGARAGLRAGDLILSVDGQPVADGIAFIDAIRATGGRTVTVEGRRAGAPFALPVTPDAERDAKRSVTVGKINAYVAQTPDMIILSSSPLHAVGKASVKVWDASVLTLRMIGKMIIGEVSWKNVTGPITIADYAGQTARIGAVSYLSFMAFISVSLGVMNLLPIPVLDGGLLLYYSLEVLTGRPVPERVGEIAQRLGVGLLVTLMLLAVFNDVSRLL